MTRYEALTREFNKAQAANNIKKMIQVTRRIDDYCKMIVEKYTAYCKNFLGPIEDLMSFKEYETWFTAED